MRTKLTLFALSGALVLTGCTPVLSLNPAVTDQEAVLDPALAGLWIEEDGRDVYSIREAGGNTYEVVFTTIGEPPEKFDGRLLRSGEIRLLDLVSKRECPFQIPAHLFLRIWLDGKTLRMAFIGSEWFTNQIARERVTAQAMDAGLVLTGPTVQVRELLLKYAAADEAHGEVGLLHRAGD